MAEFASWMLNRQSTSTTSNPNSYKKNNKTYLNSGIQSNTDNFSPKTENNVDLSWLPNYNDDNFANGHDKSCHQYEQNDFDDSWLPATYNETKKKSSPSVPILNKPNNCSHKNENGFDDSWLPSNTTVKNENKIKGQSYIKKNNTKTTSKSNNLNRSSLPCYPIVKNEDKKKESISIHRKSDNQEYWERAREATTSTAEIQHPKVLQSKKTDSSRSQGRVSPSISESSVETDSLGGVSTLLRRWKDVETKTFDRKERSSFSSNNNINHSRKPSKCFDGCTADESFIGSESCKSIPYRSLSCNIPSGTNDIMEAFDVEKENIRMGSKIKKLPKEDLAASRAVKSTSESFAKENKCVSPVLGKTRLIRGRQAYLDFLSLIEFNKRRELESLTHKRVVSKFPHRGRIQAMLRVRLIRLGAEPKLETKSYKRSVSKTMKTIWDKFSTGVKHGATASRKVNENGEDTRSHASLECSVGCNAVEDMEMTITTATSTISTTTTTATNSQELETTSTSYNQLTQEAKDHQQNTELTLDKFRDVNSSSHSIQSKEDTHSEIMVPNILDYHVKPQFQSESLNENGVKEKEYDDSIQLQSDMGLESCHNWISEYSQSQSEWDEDEFYYNDDWISEIARPQSYWEYMRQKRYQEMHHIFSYNRDLQELLDR
uniref:uncharacterized protein LOC122587685 n=1 Tax=Erigeron canadensis TaxID=72917 RepID=UPI001CB976D5|nr:uncharacterized protein LOC122587685 [Erigeron canadensis]